MFGVRGLGCEEEEVELVAVRNVMFRGTLRPRERAFIYRTFIIHVNRKYFEKDLPLVPSRSLTWSVCLWLIQARHED